MHLKSNLPLLYGAILSLASICSIAQENEHQLTYFEERLVYNALTVVHELSSHNHFLIDHLIDEYVSASWMQDVFETSTPPKHRFLSTCQGALGNEVCQKRQTHDCNAEFIYIDPEYGWVIQPEDTEDSNWLKLSWAFPTKDGLASVVISFKECEEGWVLSSVKLYS